MDIQDPFPASEFDAWAGNYDRTIQNESTFRFEGYNLVLQETNRLTGVSAGQSVLDLGIGTGNLAWLFAQKRKSS
jgi:ubiquinone/menaquinone biosynthesis C-methylase UbiE